MKYERTAEAQRVKAESRAGRLLCEVFGGSHHVQWPSFKLEPLGQASYVMHFGSLSTWDFDSLTRLVVAAHAHAVRVEIVPAMRYLKLWLSPRDRTGPIYKSHPTLAQWLERYRLALDRDETPNVSERDT